jgi:hypothetical protein
MKTLNIGKLYYYKKKPQSSFRMLKVYDEYRDGTLYMPKIDLADGDICCVIEQLPCIHSASIIAKIVLQDGRVGFVLLSTVPGSMYSLTKLSSLPLSNKQI